MTFEINCDMGELAGNDEILMPYLDACSVACGGHTGDQQSMTVTVRLAKACGVKVGAHPSFPDKPGFGRRMLQKKTDELAQSLLDQINSLISICGQENVFLDHIKPHGALYNLSTKDTETARMIIEVARQFPGVAILAPWKSELEKLAGTAGIPVRKEGFADRRYMGDGALVPRDDPEAVIIDPEIAARQVRRIYDESKTMAIDQSIIEIKAETFCVHSDNPAAEDILCRLKQLKSE